MLVRLICWLLPRKPAELAGTRKTVVFGFGTDSYIYQNDGDAAVDGGDGLVKLTGVNVNDFSKAPSTATWLLLN